MNFGDFDFTALLPFIGIGFAAQLVDGAEVAAILSIRLSLAE